MAKPLTRNVPQVATDNHAHLYSRRERVGQRDDVIPRLAGNARYPAVDAHVRAPLCGRALVAEHERDGAPLTTRRGPANSVQRKGVAQGNTGSSIGAPADG